MIEILNYEKVNKNKVIGYVDVKVTIQNIVMIIRKIAHLESGDKKWLNLPNFTRTSHDGTTSYIKYWQFETKTHTEQLLAEISTALNLFLEKNLSQFSQLSVIEPNPNATYNKLPF